MKTALQTAAALSILLVASACSPEKKAEAPAAQAPAAVAAAGTSIERLDPALDAIIAPGAVLELVSSGYKFVEGPAWIKGELWFSDLVGNKLFAVGADGKVRELMDKSGGLDSFPEGQFRGSNGLAIDKDGSVLMTQHGARRIVKLGADMTPVTYLQKIDGKNLNSPNDMVFHADGSLWFTDPPYGLPDQDKDPGHEAPNNAVYRYANGVLKAVITDLPRPNGIAFSPDGKTLYISNTEPDMFINAYAVNADGTVGPAKRFMAFPSPGVNGAPDGLDTDSAGNVWATGPGGIRIITPQGKVLGQLKSPDPAQANLTFGGPDLKTVYVMAAGNVYKLKTQIAGNKPLYTN